MRNTNERGAQGWRSSVLWGTGTRGGDSRSSSLSAKGRGVIAGALAVCALMAAIAGTAAPAKAATAGTKVTAGSNRPTWVDPALIKKSKTSPGNRVDVIITSTGGANGAVGAVSATGFLAAAEQRLAAVGGIELQIPARFIPFLQRIPGLVVTPNATVRLSGSTSLLDSTVGSTQVWPGATGNSALWSGDLANPSAAPAIAVIDSGVTPGGQFGNRVIANVNLSTLAGNTSLSDDNGHGDFVAGIAAGASPTLTGADPAAPIVSIKVMDATGTAKTSDVINACQWILDHKDQYNIRVANFSMHSSYGTNSYNDPLDKAVEKLWFSGVTVVAAAGNYATGSGPSGVLYSPGNDPFVITVGALDTNGTTQSGDDSVAPWSSYGYTEDGFSKPEIVAPGRYMVETVPALSTLLTQFPAKVLDAVTGQMQISGTSFAAPVVSGTVAEMLARHPNLTPDQVKGELMQTARPVPNAAPGQAGVGEISSYYAAHDTATPNPNAGLDQFVGADPNGGTLPVFNSDAWKAAVTANPTTWNASSWADSSWADSSWADSSWADSSWADSSWADSSWADSSWADSSWADSSWADSSWADSSWADSSWADESVADASREDAASGN